MHKGKLDLSLIVINILLSAIFKGYMGYVRILKKGHNFGTLLL